MAAILFWCGRHAHSGITNKNHRLMLNDSHAIAGGSSPYCAKRNLHHARFTCHAPDATRVSLLGDFNDWDPKAIPMLRQPDGEWMISLELTHGYHQYVFLVDGQRVLDPYATGKTRNSNNEPVSLIAVS